MKLPPPLEAVVESLQKLPGVGAKSAQRMALHLLKEGPEAMTHLAHPVPPPITQRLSAIVQRFNSVLLHGFIHDEPDL